MNPTTPECCEKFTPHASARCEECTPHASGSGLARRQSRRNKSGTSVVEMAIVLPLLLTLMFAIGEFGIMFTQYQTLINAAREGARTGVLFRGTTCAAATVKSQIATTVNSYMVGTGIQTGTLTTTSSGECAGAGTQLIVTSQVPYSFAALPGLAGLQSSITLSARSTMRNE
jgi:Flp pilus assembly protein TadG